MGRLISHSFIFEFGHFLEKLHILKKCDETYNVETNTKKTKFWKCLGCLQFSNYMAWILRLYLTPSSSYCSYSRSPLNFKQLGNVLEQWSYNFMSSASTEYTKVSKSLITIDPMNFMVLSIFWFLSSLRFCKWQYINIQGTPKIEDRSQHGPNT